MSNAQEYDAACAATVAAVAYAIAAREERLVAQEKPVSEKFTTEEELMAEKVAPGKMPASIGEPRLTLQSNLPHKRSESFKRAPIERRESSKWLSGKEPIDHGYHDQPGGINIFPNFICADFILAEKKNSID